MKRQRKLLEQQLGFVEGGPVGGGEGQSSSALVPIDDCKYWMCTCVCMCTTPLRLSLVASFGVCSLNPA